MSPHPNGQWGMTRDIVAFKLCDTVKISLDFRPTKPSLWGSAYPTVRWPIPFATAGSSVIVFVYSFTKDLRQGSGSSITQKVCHLRL